MSSKTVTSPKIAVNKGRAPTRENFVPQLEHLPYMNCCFIVWQHMADLNPFFFGIPNSAKVHSLHFFQKNISYWIKLRIFFEMSCIRTQDLPFKIAITNFLGLNMKLYGLRGLQHGRTKGFLKLLMSTVAQHWKC